MTKHAINIIIDGTMVTHSAAQRIEQRDRALALGVGFFLFAVYLLSYRGGFHSVDEVSMFAVTESLVKFGWLNTDQIVWTQWTTSQSEAQGFFGLDGHVYSKKGLAMSLAMVPLYWIGLVIPGLGMLQTASLLNAILTAATGVLLFLIVRRLGYSRQIALGVALLFGLATIAWVYSKYLFSEPLAGLLLVATIYLLTTFRQEGGNWRAALAGLLAGLAVATRANNLFLVPVFGVFLVASSRVTGSRVASSKAAGSKVVSNNDEASSEASPPASDVQRPTPYSPLRVPTPRFASLLPASRPYPLLPTSYFLLGLVPPALMLMGYNWVRAGNPFQTGYDLTLFSPNLLLGLYKLLFSPLRGLIVYSPLLVLSVPGLVWLWRQRRAEASLIIGVTGVTIVLFSVWSSGEGLSWGSRFLVPIVPLLCLALAPVLSRALAGSKVLAGLLLGLVGLSFFIQFLGVAINPWVYLAELQADFAGFASFRSGEFFLENTPALTDFRYAQIFGQLRSWSVANSDVAWWQGWGFDALALGLSLVLVIVTVANLKLPIASPVALFLFTIIITYSLLARYFITDQQFGPRNDGYTQALTTAAAQANREETAITVAPYHFHVPMNRFKERLPIIGFAPSSPPLPDTALPLLEAGMAAQNTWLATVGLPPAAPNNAVEGWLTSNVFKASDEWFDDVRLVRYGTGQPTASRRLNTTFGGEIQLESIELGESLQPGQVLPVELVWVALQRPSADYNLFLQLLAADGTLAAEHDGPPNGGYTPTSNWVPGVQVPDRHGLVLPSDLIAAEYRLIAGIYDPITGARLSVDQGGDFVELGRVTVEPFSQ